MTVMCATDKAPPSRLPHWYKLQHNCPKESPERREYLVPHPILERSGLHVQEEDGQSVEHEIQVDLLFS